jgi:hypothetical protein
MINFRTTQYIGHSADTHGRSGQVEWFRMQEYGGWAWRVAVTVCDQWLCARAVTDDFGNLVLVSRLH